MLGITKQDIEFLKELQHELNTQDHVGQAVPRFWVVAGTVKEYGIDTEYADDNCLKIDCETLLESMKDVYEYITENYEEIECKYDKNSDCIDYYSTEDEDWCMLVDMDDACSFLEKQGEYGSEVVGYRNVHKVFPSTLFLTNRECKAHIKSNYYHYPDDAHSYAMTAWRSPEVTRVWNMLEKINWDEVDKLIEKEGE